ncbi:serine/threonine-protein kinase ark1-like isoform X1 [Centruroides sculpturatus]|uniref:serine/threonine-protein kinase ark1-like isoform X1 n=1 Tax=Centruroides sculpturatus TaxID=218467 RepID=UPI000C6EBE38|nr:serine/threonine-protein kinase ark1-like isoform X1 [Centruroides sculpturatus]
MEFFRHFWYSEQKTVSNITYKKTIMKLKGEYGFSCEKELRRGDHECVVSLIDPKRKIKVAAKIVKKPRMEIEKWPELLHPNILPLYEYIIISKHTAVFITPLKIGTVSEELKKKTFTSRRDSFFLGRKWIYQIHCALQYLHKRQLYYLNVGLSNTLLSQNLDVTICGFKYLTSRKFIQDPNLIGCKKKYRSPEVFSFEERNIKAEFSTEKVDIWSVGMLSLYIMAGEGLKNKPLYRKTINIEWSNWEIEVGKTLKILLKDKWKLRDLMNSTHPLAKLTLGNSDLCLSFLNMFLQTSPSKRINIEKAMRHYFFYPFNKTSIMNIAITVCKDPNRSASTSCIKRKKLFDTFLETRRSMNDITGESLSDDIWNSKSIQKKTYGDLLREICFVS